MSSRGPAHASLRSRVRVVRNSIAFAVLGHLDDAVHEDAGQVDVVGIERAGVDQAVDLGDGHFAAVAISGLKLRAVR